MIHMLHCQHHVSQPRRLLQHAVEVLGDGVPSLELLPTVGQLLLRVGKVECRDADHRWVGGQALGTRGVGGGQGDGWAAYAKQPTACLTCSSLAAFTTYFHHLNPPRQTRAPSNPPPKASPHRMRSRRRWNRSPASCRTGCCSSAMSVPPLRTGADGRGQSETLLGLIEAELPVSSVSQAPADLPPTPTLALPCCPFLPPLTPPPTCAGSPASSSFSAGLYMHPRMKARRSAGSCLLSQVAEEGREGGRDALGWGEAQRKAARAALAAAAAVTHTCTGDCCRASLLPHNHLHPPSPSQLTDAAPRRGAALAPLRWGEPTGPCACTAPQSLEARGSRRLGAAAGTPPPSAADEMVGLCVGVVRGWSDQRLIIHQSTANKYQCQHPRLTAPAPAPNPLQTPSAPDFSPHPPGS